MDRIELEDNGFPFSAKAVRFLQGITSGAVESLCRMHGDNFIAYGCGVAGNRIEEGAIVVDGEIIPFAEGTYNQKFDIEENAESVVYKDGTQLPAYYTRVARCTANGKYELANFPRIRTVKRYEAIGWTEVPFSDQANYEETRVLSVTDMFNHYNGTPKALKASRDTGGTVSLCGGGRYGYVSSRAGSYVLATLPQAFRPASDKLVPVLAQVMMGDGASSGIYAGFATVKVNGNIVIPEELISGNGIIPYFNSQFSID